MKIFVNGEERETAAREITGLVRELGQEPRVTFVEHNGKALRPDEWSGTLIRENDRVELLRIVAGG